MSSGEEPDTQTVVREQLTDERTLPSWSRARVSLGSFGLVIESPSAKTSGASGVASAFVGCLALVMGAAWFLRSRLAYMVVAAGGPAGRDLHGLRPARGRIDSAPTEPRREADRFR